MTFNVKITPPVPPIPVRPIYPYWATNESGHLFFVTALNLGIAVTFWKETQLLIEDVLTPLPPGTKIQFEVL